MSSTHGELNVIKFGTDLMMRAQQKESLLYGKVYVKPNIVGKSFTQGRIGTWAMAERAARGSVNVQNDLVLSNRFCTLKYVSDNRVWTREDAESMAVDLASPAFSAAAASLGRDMDGAIISALGGTAATGSDGSGSATLPTTQKITVGTTNLTFAKIQKAAVILDANKVDKKDRILVITASALHSLLSDAKASSADYITTRSIMSGDIGYFYGMQVVVSEELPIATNTRYCYAYQKNALCFGTTGAPFIRLDSLQGQEYDQQLFYSYSRNGVRLEEEAVVEIAIDQTK